MEATGEYMSQDVRKTGRRGVPRLPVFLTDWHMESQALERRSDCPLSLPLPQTFHTFAILCGCAPQGRLAHVLDGNEFL